MLYSGNSPEALSREGVGVLARPGIDRLIPVVCQEMRRLAHCEMAAERTGHILQTTALAAVDPRKGQVEAGQGLVAAGNETGQRS